MSAAPSISPGTLIAGKYRVERTLGEGGMGVVLEATHMKLGQRVAIKLLLGDAATNPEIQQRFEREGQIAAQLPGDHIARVFESGTTDAGAPYLVMELLVGRDLDQDLMVRGPLPVTEAVDYLLQACEGVAEAHAAGLVHRDLKPSNLFITRKRDGTPVIKVLDFGISKATIGAGSQSLTKTTSSFGTPQYMSPEQILSSKNVDALCDQHALGAILYTLLTGQPPYDAETLTAISVVIATQPPPSVIAVRPDVHPALEAAIHQALAKQPSGRFPSLAELAAAIAPFGGEGAWTSLKNILGALGKPIPAGLRPLYPSESGLLRVPGYAGQGDSGLIRVSELNAIEERTPVRGSAPVEGSSSPFASTPAPPPGMPQRHSPHTIAALSTAVDTQRSRPRKALIAALAGGVTLVGILIAVFVSGGDTPAGDVQATTPPPEPPVTAPLPTTPPEVAPAATSAAPTIAPVESAEPPKPIPTKTPIKPPTTNTKQGTTKKTNADPWRTR